MSYSCNSAEGLSFSWTQINGPTVALSNPRACKTTFVPEEEGVYEFVLTVSDGARSSEPDRIKVFAGHNQGPLVQAGMNQCFSNIPSRVHLDGSGSSDPDGDAILFQWTQIGGPRVDMNEPNSVSANFEPHECGYYEFELTLEDDRGALDVNTVEILIGSDQMFLADAGLPIYTASDSVQLDGFGSHTKTGALPSGYSWRQIDGPYPLRITSADTATPICHGITQDETIQRFTIALTVEDRHEQSMPDATQLIVVPFLRVDNRLNLENRVFDPLKPTIIFFGFDEFYTQTGTGYMPWDSEVWCDKANIIGVDFTQDAWPEDPLPRSYRQCGDSLIAYLHSVAPMYDQPIQAVGLGAGGTVAIEVARHLNLTYQDSRYAVNRVTLLCFGALDFYPLQDAIYALTANGVGEETCRIDNYFILPRPRNSAATFQLDAFNVAFSNATLLSVFQWYKSSLACIDLDARDDAIAGGADLSVVGVAWDEPALPGNFRYRRKGEDVACGRFVDYEDSNKP